MKNKCQSYKKSDEDLTPLRDRVLKILRKSKTPVKAYDILDLLKAKPPTVYRTLDYLMQSGLIHKIETTNAFVACRHPREPHCSQFFVCAKCGASEELNKPAISRAVARWAKETQFSITPRSIEITGICKYCTAAR
ncbi:MAG: transcriptional repressor [Verrucomicrobiota bacterium]